ncbi:MAG: hypothetical protein K0Q72_1134 [Armatimonadetes bacterium]|jgi:hypothetical protein|nr:hypothetical protein [Armatimonadota bacterium]
MGARQKIGQYRHRQGVTYEPGPGGELRIKRDRKRFPHLGMIPLVFGISGSGVCALVSWLMAASGTKLLPQRLDNTALPPSPSIENVLFGAGFPEAALACGLIGFLIWRSLWAIRITPEEQARGRGVIFRALVGQGIGWGAVYGFLAIPIGVAGLYMRTAPAAQPPVVRPFFALLASPILTVSAFVTVVIPLVVLVLGMLLGLSVAASAALIWRDFPEEPRHL